MGFSPAAFPLLTNIIFSLGFAILIGIKGVRHPANLGFALAMLGQALQEVSTFFITTATHSNPVFFLGKFTLLSSVMMSGGWLIFSITFARPDPAEVLKRKVPFIGFYLSLLLFLFFPVFEKNLSVDGFIRTLYVSNTGFVFFILYLILLVSILMNLEQTFRESSGLTRYRIKYMLLGAGAILALEIYKAAQVLLFSVFSLDILPIYSIALIMSNLLLLFAVVRHRLLNVEVFVSRYVVYKSVTLLAVGVYLGTVGLIITGIQRFGGGTYIRLVPIVVFAALLAMIILLLSDELRRKMQTFINVHFYRNKHDYRNKWQEFTSSVGSKLALPELLPSLVTWMCETMGTNDCAIWLLDKERNRYYLASRRGFSSAPPIWSDQSQLIETIKKGGGPLELTDNNLRFETLSQEAVSFFEASPVTAWIPLYSNEEMIGVFSLGKKITEEGYDYHDLELLMTIADQAAGQIDRVRLIEELGVVRELKAIHTLSSFFLHDLKNYTSTLSLLAQNVTKHGSNPDFQKDAFKTIQGTVDKMNQLIKHITVVAKGLVLSRSEVDLNALIERTLSGLDGALGLKGRICYLFGDLPVLSADPEQLANVLRNLTINASNANKEGGVVTIETRFENEQIFLSVSDEGSGMTEEFISTKLFKPLRTSRAAGWGIGLFQCQQIVKAHGGNILVESEVGVGSTFTVKLPIGGEK